MGGEVQPRPSPTASHSTPSLTAPVRQCPNVPANSRQSGPRAPLAVSYPAISLTTATVGRHRHPQKRLQTAADPASTRIRAPTIHVCYFLSPLPVSSPRPSLSIGGFGLRRGCSRLVFHPDLPLVDLTLLQEQTQGHELHCRAQDQQNYGPDTEFPEVLRNHSHRSLPDTRLGCVS